MRPVKGRKVQKKKAAKAAKRATARPQFRAKPAARAARARVRLAAPARTEPARTPSGEGVGLPESVFGMGAQIVSRHQEYTRAAAAQWLRLWSAPWRLAASPQPAGAPALSPTTGLRSSVPAATPGKPRSSSKSVASSPAAAHKRAGRHARKAGRHKKR